MMDGSSSKKVLHVVEAFGGGVYYFLKDLVNRPELKEFDSVIYYACRGNLDEKQLREDFPNATLIFWPHAQREIHPYRDLKALREVNRVIHQLNPDLIHCHSSKAGVLGRISAWMKGKRRRVIYSPHGLSFLKLDDSKWKRKFYQYIERVCAGLAGTVVGCSPSEAKALNDRGIPARAIQSGIALPVGPLEKSFSAPIKVVTVGQIYVPKNPTLFNEIAEAMPETQFLWVGDGNLRHCLTAKNIQITGWIPREKISKVLEEAHIYLSTSLWEGLPLSVLEAMGNGLPLLLRDCVGNVDLVKEENGYLFHEKEEAVARLKQMIASPKSLEKMGQASLKIAQDGFSIGKMAENYRELYIEKVSSK